MSHSESREMAAVRAALYGLPNGPVCDEAKAGVVKALQQAWNSLDGCNQTRLTAGKLPRSEDLRWHKPFLTFRIERHGKLCNGGTRAEIQEWSVDTDSWVATWCNASYRQLLPRAPSYSKNMANEQAKDVSDLIAAGIRGDKRVRWVDGDTVRIKFAECVPHSPYKETRGGRNRRFRDALDVRLATIDWRWVRGWTYERVFCR